MSYLTPLVLSLTHCTDYCAKTTCKPTSWSFHSNRHVQERHIHGLLSLPVPQLPRAIHGTLTVQNAVVAKLTLLQCLTYLSLSGLLAGVDADLSFYLLSIANACSLVGRLGGGVLADRFGEFKPQLLSRRVVLIIGSRTIQVR